MWNITDHHSQVIPISGLTATMRITVNLTDMCRGMVTGLSQAEIAHMFQVAGSQPHAATIGSQVVGTEIEVIEQLELPDSDFIYFAFGHYLTIRLKINSLNLC